jgi:transposase
MTKLKIGDIKHFIGIDISKNKLDLCILNEGEIVGQKVIANKPDAIKDFLEELKEIADYSLKKTLFCMENTGLYGNHLMQVLHLVKADLVVENALHIKQSMGLVRDKSDEKDALRIALYAMRHLDQVKLWQPPRPEITRLRHLAELRDRLVVVSGSLKVPIKEQGIFLSDGLKEELLNLSESSLASIRSDILDIEKMIDHVIKSDDALSRLNKVVMSVPGIGRHTALQLIIKTNEFKNYADPGKFACYAGVVPFKSESGQQTSRARLSPIANKKMKKLLHLCAVRVIRVDPEIKQYYLRKTGEDKKAKMLVLNAIRNKLLRRVFACVRDSRLFTVRHNDTLTESGYE